MDVLSGGRIILGAGVGWMEEEFQALSAPSYKERGRVTDEFIRLMREMWTREPVDFKGQYYTLRPVSALPKPVQKGGIPVWTGGHTEPALRRAGQVADGWHPIGLRPPGLLEPKEYAREGGGGAGVGAQGGTRSQGASRMSYRVPLELRPRGAKPAGGDRTLFRGTAAEVIEDIRTYQRLGVTHFVWDLTATDLKGALALLERFAATCVPRSSASRGSGPMPALPEPVAGFISAGRVGRLGTADAPDEPLVVPFCYAWDGAAIFSAIDAKPKRAPRPSLRRVRNIQANPTVSVVIDEYDEDWSRLRWVIIQGRAEILTGGPEFQRGTELLLEKYPQYRRMGLPARAGHHDQGDAGPHQPLELRADERARSRARPRRRRTRARRRPGRGAPRHARTSACPSCSPPPARFATAATAAGSRSRPRSSSR